MSDRGQGVEPPYADTKMEMVESLLFWPVVCFTFILLTNIIG